MHASSPSTAEALRLFPHAGSRRTRQSGFSLVEITMAIGIIAFAFVALLGLLPTGLRVFRESIDSSNEMWIAQNLNAMMQVTEWEKMEKLEDYTFYFDEEGRLTDRESPDGGDVAEEETKLRRLYAVKLLIANQARPGDDDAGSESATGPENEYSQNVIRVVAVIAPYLKPAAMKEFDSIDQIKDIRSLPKNTSLKTKAFLVSRMESLK